MKKDFIVKLIFYKICISFLDFYCLQNPNKDFPNVKQRVLFRNWVVLKQKHTSFSILRLTQKKVYSLINIDIIYQIVRGLLHFMVEIVNTSRVYKHSVKDLRNKTEQQIRRRYGRVLTCTINNVDIKREYGGKKKSTAIKTKVKLVTSMTKSLNKR